MFIKKALSTDFQQESEKFGIILVNIELNVYICTEFCEKEKRVMANTDYITIKNASRKVLQRMRQIGIEKAQRLQEIQKRWDAGEYKNTEIVQL